MILPVWFYKCVELYFQFIDSDLNFKLFMVIFIVGQNTLSINTWRTSTPSTKMSAHFW